MKKCYICKETKNLDEFYNDKSRPDGKGTKCKLCANTYSKRVQVLSVPEFKFCNTCEEIRHSSRFHKKKDSLDGLYGSCKKCRNSLRRELYALNVGHARKLCTLQREANPERTKELRSKHHAKRRRRKLNAPGHHTEIQWQRKLVKLGNKCYYCKSSEDLQKDHMIPLSKGGTDYISNIVPACKSCNCSKRDSTAVEFIRRRALDKLQ